MTNRCTDISSISSCGTLRKLGGFKLDFSVKSRTVDIGPSKRADQHETSSFLVTSTTANLTYPHSQPNADKRLDRKRKVGPLI